MAPYLLVVGGGWLAYHLYRSRQSQQAADQARVTLPALFAASGEPATGSFPPGGTVSGGSLSPAPSGTGVTKKPAAPAKTVPLGIPGHDPTTGKPVGGKGVTF